MLKRAFVHLSLILLFAFTQMGVATHAISHIAEGHEHHEQDQDQNHHENQCGQCISLSHIANANIAPAFDFALSTTGHIYIASTSASFKARTLSPYIARGPPATSQT